jgi:flavin reductase (DIM6/NTAB) family NADH-FMN oxidoreductase RutF
MLEVPLNQAWKNKYPEQIVFVVSLDQQGRPNIMVAGWFVPLSGEPPLIGVSLAEERYSLQLVLETKEFVIAFPSEDMAQEVLVCGTKSGRDIDKLKETNLKKLPARKVKVPLIDGCVVNFECRLVEDLPVGDHVLLVGEILTAHISEQDKRRLYNFGNLQFKGI